jgi:hypothetical protein
MKLQQLAEALDAQILKGDIVGAFEKFAAENCVTKSNPQDITKTKSQKLEILGWFFSNIAATNRIERLAFQVGDNTSESQFVFEFVTKQGQPLIYNEVIRRTWADGKVVEEQYLLNQSIKDSKKAAAIKSSKKEVAPEVQPAAAKAAVVAEPKAAAKPAAKVVAKTTVATEPKATKPAAKTAKATAAPTAAKKPAAKSATPKAGRK